MIGAFESSVQTVFHGDYKNAREAAILQAANTNGLVLEVRAISLASQIVSFNGVLPKAHFINNIAQALAEDATFVSCRPSVYGCFHSTWEKFLSTLSPIGFLTFHPPISFKYIFTCEDDSFMGGDELSVTIEAERHAFSIRAKHCGQRICKKCGKPIPEARIQAMPQATYCVECVIQVEKGEKDEGK